MISITHSQKSRSNLAEEVNRFLSHNKYKSHLIQIQTLKLARATSSMMTLVMKRMYWRVSSLLEAVSKSEFLTEL